ncbi:MAG: TFIIB-type zinc ribbon-containing protein [Conexivisphaerales archaeon]
MPFKKLSSGEAGGIEKCPVCGSRDLLHDSDTGEIICAKCGFVIKERVESTEPEWRAYTKDENEGRARAGLPETLGMDDMGLSTVIDSTDRDASGKVISKDNKEAYYRLRKWDSRSKVHSSESRNLRQAMFVLDRIVDKLSVPNNILEMAAYIYRKVLEKDLVRGRSIQVLVAASLYAACRQMQVPRSLNDLVLASNIRRKDLAKGYRLIVKELDMKMSVDNPVKQISRIATRAGLNERINRIAVDIIKKAMQAGITAGKDPVGLAAAALYAASILDGRKKTQKDIAEAAGVTEVTIRNRYKGLISFLEKK